MNGMVMIPGDDPRLRADPAKGWPVLLVIVFGGLLAWGALTLF